MKRLVIALALMLAAGSTITAQEVEKGSKQRWRNFETNRFIDNWELSVGAGVQTYYLTKWKSTNNPVNPEGFGKDFTFAFDAALGKWVTPIIGARLAFNGLTVTNYLTEGGEAVDHNTWTVHADAMFNLTNWICRYKADRFYNAIAFVGVGFSDVKLDVDDASHNPEFVVPVGLINRFRLCDAWTFNIELRDQISAPGMFGNNAQTETKAVNGNLLSATAGFTWKFSKVRNFKAYTPIDKSLYDNRISSLESDLQAANDKNAEYQKQIDRYKKQLSDKERELQNALKEAAKNKGVAVNDDVTLSIFFPIGSAEVSDKNEINIKYMADVIKASNKTFTITGYADNNTGSESRNLELSQERAEAVYNALINAGVDKSKVKVDYKGCSVQPFEKDYLNRVAIIK